MCSDSESDDFGQLDWEAASVIGENDEPAVQPESASEPAKPVEPVVAKPEAGAELPRPELARPQLARPEQEACERVRKQRPQLSPDSRKRQRMERAELLQQRVLFMLCMLCRLRWLSSVCDNQFLQAMLQSIVARPELASLREAINKPQTDGPNWVGSPTSLMGLLVALKARSSSILQLCLLFVARRRAEGQPARVVMALPLEAPGAILWPEIHVSGKWQPVLQLRADGADAFSGQPSLKRFAWVAAVGEDGDIVDVTARYWERWSDVTRARGSLSKLWERAMKELGGVQPAEANQLDSQALLQRAKREPIPKSRAAFKRHLSYVLESQLSQHECVSPLGKASPVGLFQGKDAIWRRTDIVSLKSKTQWRAQARVVKAGERAVKVVPGPPGLPLTGLYGEWQTEAERPAVSEGDKIPGVNEFGSIDLGARLEKLPAGTVYLADDEGLAAAHRCRVTFATVVTGFTREHGMVKPEFGGVVVWQRDAATVQIAIQAEKLRRAHLEEKRHRERMMAAWQQLIKQTLSDHYVRASYAALQEAPEVATETFDNFDPTCE